MTSPRLQASNEAVGCARPEVAVVVFVRRPSANAVSAVAVVDGSGRYLGDSVPDSQWQIEVPPGEHFFVAWDRFGEGNPEEDWYEKRYGAE